MCDSEVVDQYLSVLSESSTANIIHSTDVVNHIISVLHTKGDCGQYL